MPKRADPTGFADKLRELREAAGLTQEQLAERAGLHTLSVAKLEQGVREPTWATVLELAEALGVSVAKFAEQTVNRAAKRVRGRPPKAVPPTPPVGEPRATSKRRRK
jgi:transcriptional regulator with XRE-family HTH domain